MLPPPVAAAPAAPAGTLALLCFALLLFGARRGDILHFSQRNVNLVLTLCNFLLPTKCFGLAPPLNPAHLPVAVAPQHGYGRVVALCKHGSNPRHGHHGVR